MTSAEGASWAGSSEEVEIKATARKENRDIKWGVFFKNEAVKSLG